jgi:carbonic anhydrase
MVKMRNSQITPVTDAKLALEALKAGNKRFVEGKPEQKDHHADRTATIDSQKPFATVLTCADSRTCPEIIFDTKIGDLFVLRNAGNFATDSELGSLEFSSAVLGSPIIIVMGHTNCGAVFAAFDKPEGLPAKLQCVIENLIPGIEGAADKGAATEANTQTVVDLIKANPIVQEKGTLVLGAYYNLRTGEVTFNE